MRTFVAALALGMGLSACTPAPPRELIVRAGRLIDGTGAAARDAMRLRISDGSIVAVEPDNEPFAPAPGVAVLDARQLTVLPGLIRTHAQVLVSGGELQVGEALRSLHALVRDGVTTVAVLGAPAAAGVALRRHVGTARHRGPRLMVAGPLLTAAGGYPLDHLGPQCLELGQVQEVRTTLGVRATVRRLAARDVDLIAVALQERGRDGQSLPMLDGEALCTLVEEAHRQELRVMGYAASEGGYEAALACAVDTVVPDAMVPPGSDLEARLLGAGIAVAPDVAADILAVGDTPLAMLQRLHGSGLEPMQALRAASHGSARVLNLHDALGRLEVGFRADLIAVAGRPDERLEDMAQVQHVIIDGVLQDPDGPGWLQRLAARLSIGWALFQSE